MANGGRFRILPAFWFSTDNFGDAISPFLMKEGTGLHPYLDHLGTQPRMLAVGSIVHRGRPGDAVWGSGSLWPRRPEHAADMRVFAVRGPLTNSLFDRQDSGVPVFGDPVQLLPRFYTPRTDVPTSTIGIVPHYDDLSKIGAAFDRSVRVINPLAPWREVVDMICSCEVVFSSSLHGLIVAEAYGRLGCWIRIGDLPLGGMHKFHDYLLATGREPREPTALDPSTARFPDEVLATPTPFDATTFLDAGRRAVKALADDRRTD